MKENELTIKIPDGKIVDWDESKKQNKIVLKDKQLTYEDICKELFKNKIVYYTDAKGDISNIPFSVLGKDNPYDSNNASNKHQLECILAKNKLANVAKYLNDGWKPVKGDEVWYNVLAHGRCISTYSVETLCNFHVSSRVIFKSEEFAQRAIEILGEETIKLALEPLGM